MPRKKQQKIQALHSITNVIEMSDPNLKNKLADFLAKTKNINLELGCGKGEYTLALAKMFPQKKFIGIDIQGERLWHGATLASTNQLINVLFLRIPVENIINLFAAQSINEIWLTFPDPQPRTGDIKKRLTSPRFLNIYKNILKTNGLLHLKTDNQKLFDYSQASIIEQGGQVLASQILTAANLSNPTLQITTTYENIYRKQGKSIYYLKAKLCH